MERSLAPLLAAALLGAAPAGASPPSTVERADKLAGDAVEAAATDPARGLAIANQALALTRDFDPTAFARAGRHGEVVEDVFVAARRAYRAHRARLYEAKGAVLLAAGQPKEAVRYLGRARELDPKQEPVRLARALVAEGRGGTALDVLLERMGDSLGREALAAAREAADAAGLASLQAALDRVRIGRLSPDLGVEWREGPLKLPRELRVSTGAPFRLDVPGLTLVYAAETSCRTCSADLEAISDLAPAGARVFVASEDPDSDEALRQAMRLYHFDWPVLFRVSFPRALTLRAPAVLVVGRDGFSAAVARSPFERGLPAVLQVMRRTDLRESLPRPAWTGRPAEIAPLPPGPPLLPEGLAPGEDQPSPPDFEAAVAAYRKGRFAEALRGFRKVAARDDGWLLPPEARLDEALSLAGLGRKQEARRILLRIGDSRFQDGVDRALERVAN